MSADSAVVNSGPLYHTDKIFRVGLSLLGTAGDGYMSLAFVEWFKSKRNMHTLHKMIPLDHRHEISIVELKPGGIYLWNGWGLPERIHEKFYAIGSGSMAAIAELARGSDTAEAVRAATRWDENSDAPIQTVLLKPPRRKRG